MAAVNRKIELDLGNVAGNAQGAKDKKTQAQVYLNPGFHSQDPQTGEMVFISIPVGIGIDTQKPLDIKGQNEEWNAKARAMNALLEKLQRVGAGLEPGEEVELPQLTLQMRRRKPAAETSDENNAHMAALDALDFGV